MTHHVWRTTDFYYRGWTGEPWPDPDPDPEPDPEPEPDPDPDLPADPDPQSADACWRGAAPGGHGLILGRFMPPHLGHDHLIEVAKREVTQLSVLVAARSGDPIDVRQRAAWLRQMHPDIDVDTLRMDGLPSARASGYWSALTTAVRHTLCGRGVDVVFASEPRAKPLARMLRAEFALVDPDRETVPVSATMIRQDPTAHWEYIPACVRPYFVRRVCLLGPEGCGKSTLVRQLADHFETRGVQEVARDFATRHGRDLSVADFETIAREQVMLESAERQFANRLLLCDTELLSAALWCERLHGESPSWIREAARQRVDTLYLICAPDLPYPGKPVFGGEPARQRFFERCLDEVRGRWPFAVIRGEGESRLDSAVSAVEDLVGRGPSGQTHLDTRREQRQERG